MTRGVTLLSILLAALAVALPAGASEGRAARGTVTSLTSESVSVQDAKGVVTTCARTRRSPSLDGYRPGDTVQIACARVGSRLALLKIRRLRTAPAGDAPPEPPTTHPSEPTAPDEPAPDDRQTFAGAVTAVSDTSLTLRDGDHTFTCSRGPSSPSTAELKVGAHARVTCANGVLVSLEVLTAPTPPPVPPPTPPAPPVEHQTTGAAGTLTALSASSLTVHSTEKNVDVTCALGASSPRVGDFHVGDHVGMLCVDGTVAKLVRL